MATERLDARRAEGLILNMRPREDLLHNAHREARVRGLHDIAIFDVDCHIIETMRLAEIVPYISNEAIRDRYEMVPESAGLNLPSTYGDKDVAGRIYRSEHVPGTRGVPRIADLLGDLRLMGVDHASVFPTPMLALGEHPEVDVEVALGRAYNRWLIDHVLIDHPTLKAMLYLPFNDPEAALEEVVELGDKPGVVGFLVTSVRRNPVYHDAFMPVYAALEERGLPIGFHGGVNWTKDSASGALNRFLTVHALDFPLYNMIHLFNIIINGLPERFPRLKWVFYEAGLSWLAFVAMRLDHEYMMRPSEAPQLRKKPSEYLKDMYFATQPLEYPSKIEYLEMIFDMVNGGSQFLYASDYPHWDFDLPSKIYDLPFLSEREKLQVLGGNAYRLFNMESEATGLTRLENRAV
ncbi:MAG: amidohydrolase [Pseudonocardia sp.]|nr:amidohydrolase [Pseudonocardia sp.]